MQHINIKEPKSKLSWKILEDFCLAAVEIIKTQCGWEYGSANKSEKTRATVLSELCIDELEGLPTNNLTVERDFSKFDCLWKIGKSRNSKFKRKVIRNSLDLISGDNFGVEKIAEKVMLMLTDRETNWDDQQKIKLQLQLTEEVENGRKTQDYIKTMLVDCKTWDGPCASVDELELIPRQNPDRSCKIIKTEMAFYSHTHKVSNQIKLNGITSKKNLKI